MINNMKDQLLSDLDFLGIDIRNRYSFSFTHTDSNAVPDGTLKKIRKELSGIDKNYMNNREIVEFMIYMFGDPVIVANKDNE